MNALKNLAKKVLGLDPHSNVKALKNLIYAGSVHHGYHIPRSFLTSSSICYCVGAGIDISLDIELATRFGCQVFIFDPMPYAAEHFEELVTKTFNNELLYIGNAETSYTYKINTDQLSKIKFIKTGVWNEKKKVKFYIPSKENYAGHSITNLQKTNDYIEAEVDTLKGIMNELQHSHIDLLKIEIEGSEYSVINDLVKNKIDVKIILVEFDEFHHKEGKSFGTMNRIKKSTDQLLNAGYTLVHSISHYKRTFIRNDVYQLLKSQD